PRRPDKMAHDALRNQMAVRLGAVEANVANASPSLLNLFDRIPTRIHAGRKSTLECIHFLVVFGFGLIGLMLHLCTCRLRRLLLGLFVRRTLLSSTTHGTEGSAHGRAPACVTGNRSDRRASQGSLGCSACSSSLRFWCVRSSLLFGSLHL